MAFLQMLLNTRVEESLVHLRGWDCSAASEGSSAKSVASVLTVNSREISERICLGESTGAPRHELEKVWMGTCIVHTSKHL